MIPYQRNRISPFLILFIATFVAIFSFIVVTMTVAGLGYFGLIKTNEIQATVMQIVPEIDCSPGLNSGCSNHYHITLRASDGKAYYSTLYTNWHLPYIGQPVSLRYVNGYWPFNDFVVDIK